MRTKSANTSTAYRARAAACTVVQKIAQGRTPQVRPVYEILSMEGPPHEPVITARVTVKGIGMAEAKGRSKASAEAAAAAALLAKLEEDR